MFFIMSKQTYIYPIIQTSIIFPYITDNDPLYLHYKSNIAQRLSFVQVLEDFLSRISIRKIQTFTSKIEKPGNTEKPRFDLWKPGQNLLFTNTMKWSCSHFKHNARWGLIGINLKKSVFSIPTFPEIKPKWSPNGATSRFPESNSLPDRSRMIPRPFSNLVLSILIGF